MAIKVNRRNIIIIALVLIVVAVGGVGAYLAFGRSPEQRAAQFLESGTEYFKKGDYTKANLELRNALQLKENLPEAWFMLAKIAEKKQNLKGAFDFLRRTVEIAPQNLEAQLELGKIYLGGNQLDKALEQSDIVMKLDDGNANIRAFHGAVLLRLSDLEGAISEANAALKIDPKNINAIVVKSAGLRSQKQLPQALSVANDGLKIDPANLALNLLKIQILESSDQIENAIDAYRAAIKQNVNQNAFRRGLVNLLLRHDRTDDAEAVFREIVASAPENTDTKIEFIRFLRSVRNPEAAETQLKKFISDKPTQYELQFALAALYQREKRQNDASEIYKHIIEIDGKGPAGLSAKSRLAALAFAGGDVATGNRLIEEVIETEPRNPEALEIRAQHRLSKSRTEEAIADLRTILRDAPDDPTALLLLARAHRQNGDMDLAAERYVQAYVKNPQRNDIRMEYANFMFRRGDFKRTEEVLNSVLSIEPNQLNALRLMTRVKLARQDWAGAQEYAERIETSSGHNVFTEEVMGTVYRAQKNIDASIESFKRAHELAPEASTPILALVRTMVDSGRRDEAKEFLLKVIGAYKGNIAAHLLLGQIYAGEDNNEKAASTFQNLIDIAPHNPAGYRALSLLHRHIGDLDGSEKVILEGVKANPDDATLLLSLAGIYEQNREYGKAIDIYQKVVEKNPRNLVAVNNLASMLSDHRSDQKSLEKALELAEILKNTKFPYFRDTLGWIYFRLGQYEQSVALHKEVVDALPQVPIFHYHLGMAYRALGDREKAKAELEKAVELGQKNFNELEDAKAALANL